MVLQRRDGTEKWTEGEILETWEVPLKLLTAAVITIALGLLAVRVI